LLGHPECVSYEADLTGDTSFREILDDPEMTGDVSHIKRVVLCSGKVYYDLVNYRRTQGISDAAIVRVEQFYPFNRELFRQILGRYPRGKTRLVWCQEESKNMGGWSFIAPRLQQEIAHHLKGFVLRFAGRGASASPAAGAKVLHTREQTKLIDDAFRV
jgi:2-oxoglutarate dehydrogenase E1 component